MPKEPPPTDNEIAVRLNEMLAIFMAEKSRGAARSALAFDLALLAAEIQGRHGPLNGAGPPEMEHLLKEVRETQEKATGCCSGLQGIEEYLLLRMGLIQHAPGPDGVNP